MLPQSATSKCYLKVLPQSNRLTMMVDDVFSPSTSHGGDAGGRVLVIPETIRPDSGWH